MILFIKSVFKSVYKALKLMSLPTSEKKKEKKSYKISGVYSVCPFPFLPC